MLERFSQKFGFTRTEILVIIFLISLFIVGYVYVELIKPGKTPDNKFVDYSREDSLFNYYNKLDFSDDADNSETMNRQKIRNEILELNDTIAYVSNDTEPLKEKSINLNTADIEELTRLPGIGEKTAEKIIELRTERGNFKKIEELMDVKGIGEVKFNKIKNFLYIK
jgi:competence protein ComEA